MFSTRWPKGVCLLVHRPLWNSSTTQLLENSRENHLTPSFPACVRSSPPEQLVAQWSNIWPLSSHFLQKLGIIWMPMEALVSFLLNPYPFTGIYPHNSEKAMAPHSSTLAWKIPWMEEPGRLQSMGSWRVGHDWATSLSLFTFIHWRRKWQPTPVFLPGESQGRGSLVGCHLWGRTELDTTEAT